MKKIILDTNFLLIPGSLKVDIFAEIDRICLFKYQVCVLDKTINELKKLAEGKSKTAKNAKLGLDLIKQKEVKIIKTENQKLTHTDDLILALADKNTLVATQDRELKKRLKSIPLIILRKKKYLDLKLP